VGTLWRGKIKSAPVQAARLITFVAEPATVEVERKPPEPPKSVAPAPERSPQPAVQPPSSERREPLTVQITRPKPGEKLGGYLIVSGATQAGARVEIRVSYTNDRAGLLSISGVLAEEQVTADAKGEFHSKHILLDRGLSSSGLRFIVTARAVGKDGSRSRAAVVEAVGRGY